MLHLDVVAGPIETEHFGDAGELYFVQYHPATDYVASLPEKGFGLFLNHRDEVCRTEFGWCSGATPEEAFGRLTVDGRSIHPQAMDALRRLVVP